ncbi:uncharacterized protein LOC133205196 [Saccostrea echinata]|uniref:uncharacterized protein LOC133175473 n=1 Tax=Saccostrea echinata TaxID=191078 RepID=UPI002A80C3EE|nr:uncharacterized protein LOC133175473 [Saccostrea echinata]XP_061196940.1 uncharacterized protein LOC133205196 [Saccostrea echinata]
MNSQSYKRKRMDVQYPNPEVASSIYKRLGVDILTTPTTSGGIEEVEPPRKRYIQAVSQAVFHNIGSTRTAGRVVTNGVAKPLLSNEQIQQFITSTVLPNGRSVTSTEAVNPDPSQPGTRIDQQTDCTNVHPQLTLNVLRSGQTLPWMSIQQQSQETVLQKQTEYNDQSTVQQLVLNSQGNIHPSAQNAFAVHILNPTLTKAGPQQPISANELILPTNVEVQGYTPTIVPHEWVKRTELQVPTNIISVPSVAGVYDQTIYLPTQTIYGDGNYSPVETPTCNVATTGLSAGYSQRCSAAQLESWSLSPQSVPTCVAPMEAQTKTKTKKSRKKTPTDVSQKQYANADKSKQASNSSMAKGSRNLAKMDGRPMQQTTGKQMEATLHQTQSKNSAPTSVTQKGGKKRVKRIVVPPKVQTDPVEYPPYVARIMRILNRQKQGHGESTDDNKESVDSTPRQITTAGKNDKDRANSTPKQATTAEEKAMDTVNSNPKQKEPQSVVSLRTPVTLKQPAMEQKHKSLSGSTVQKVIEKCSQLNSGSKEEPISIRKTLPEDYRPVVNTTLLLDDLSPDSFTLLEADNFYGPEILVTSGSHCFVVSVPFF